MKDNNHKDDEDVKKAQESKDKGNENGANNESPNGPEAIRASDAADGNSEDDDDDNDDVNSPVIVSSSESSNFKTPSNKRESLVLMKKNSSEGKIVIRHMLEKDEEAETHTSIEQHQKDFLARLPQQTVMLEEEQQQQQQQEHPNSSDVCPPRRRSRNSLDETMNSFTLTECTAPPAPLPTGRATASSMMSRRRLLQSKQRMRDERSALSRSCYEEEEPDHQPPSGSKSSPVGDIETGVELEKDTRVPLPTTSLDRRTRRTSLPGAFAMPSMGFAPVREHTETAAAAAVPDDNFELSTPPALSSSSRPEEDETRNEIAVVALDAEVVDEQTEINRRKELDALRKKRQDLEIEQTRQSDEPSTSWSDENEESTVNLEEMDAVDEPEVRRHRRRLVPSCTRRLICSFGLLILVMGGTVIGVTLGRSRAGDDTNSGQQEIEEKKTGKCFENRQELLKAVDAYLLDRGPDTVVAQTYGLPINSWCVSKVTDFSGLFWDERNPKAAGFFEQIHDWDMSSATNLKRMLSGSNVDAPLDKWDVSRVTDMSYLFAGAKQFNVRGSESLHWNVSAVKDMSFMFQGATAFNKGLSTWDISQVTTTRSMFQDASAFNQDLSAWNVSSTTDMRNMFQGASSFRQNLCAWGTALERERTLVSGMFENTACPATEEVDLAGSPSGPFCFECT